MIETVRLRLAELDIEARLPTKFPTIQEGWHDFDILMEVTILIEIGVTFAIWGFLRFHGQ